MAFEGKIQRVAAKKRANKTNKRKHREPEAEEEEEPQDDSPPTDENEGSVAPSDSTVVNG
jgi:hypothetical protein